MKEKNELWNACKGGKVLIAAHRGAAGGNIPCNTRGAFEAALYQGADILETDVTAAGDGELFIFHPGMEKAQLKFEGHIEQMTGNEIRALRYINGDDTITECPLLSLEEFLTAFKGRSIINLDHAWDDLLKVIETVRRHEMEKQILIKSPANLKYAEIMEEIAPDIMFMPIIGKKDEISESLEKMNLNFAGVEVLFETEQDLVAQKEYIEAHHKKGRVVWANAIVYDYKAQLTAGHSDDVAMSGNPEYGWGWLLDQGFDIIQTDWILPLKRFIKERT